jgi:purine-binding chemotaxis protein CheW
MSEQHPNAAAEASVYKHAARQVLSFTLEHETYAVDILRVREIRGFSAVTHMPDTPSHLLGVLNLRGSIVPIVDMRRRIGIAAMDPSALTVIIVLSVESARGRREFGLVVDGVSDVVDLAPENIKETPDLDGGNSEHLISAIASVNDRLILVLDVDRMLAGEKLELAAA